MTAEQKKIILATVPVLREQGMALTTHFYNRMFKYNPELKNLFNMGNQQNGRQQAALANAVLAYAENISNPQVLMPVIDSIGQKHASLDIRPEQYIIVGKHLIASIREVLGEGATPEIIDAWESAYGQLARIMSGHEANLYKAQTERINGWAGWRLFRVMCKEMESTEICSFYLYPADGGKVPLHLPGQYISLKMLLPELSMNQIRQYSISSAPADTHYRISVKKEYDSNKNINGMISNYLHNSVQVGTFLELSAPSGNFVLPDAINAPLVFISGGVGITPFMSMLEHLLEQKVKFPITLIHGCRNESVHAFKDRIKMLEANNDNLKTYTFYDQCTEENKVQGITEGYPDINKIKNFGQETAATYFICGPSSFISKQINDLKKCGKDSKQLFFEEFGPQSLTLN